jgi:hypothetical protein
MRKPRTKKYRPKNSNPSGGLLAIAGLDELSKSQAAEISRGHHLALSLIENGKGRYEDLNTVACALHTAKALSEAGYGPEYEARLKTAIEASNRAMDRAIAGTGLGFDGIGLQAVRTGLMVHDAQLDGVQAKHFVLAMKEVARRSQMGIAYGVAA